MTTETEPDPTRTSPTSESNYYKEKRTHWGAVRISTSVSRNVVLATSFLNADGTMATIVMNKSDEPIDYSFFLKDEQIDLNIPARAMQTLVY